MFATEEQRKFDIPRICRSEALFCIGAEPDLQLYTRRLHGWRAALGSETCCDREFGQALLASNASALDWMREHLSAEG